MSAGVPETAGEEPGADERHHRQRHLRDHEQTLQAVRTGAGGPAPSALLEDFVRPGSAGEQGRNRAGQQRDQRRRQRDEAERLRVQPGAELQGDVHDGKEEQEERLAHPRRQCHPDHRAEGREQRGLDEQLRGETRARGPHGQPDRELPLAGDAACQQQVRHVGADDEQEDQRERHQDPERLEQHSLRPEMSLPDRRHRQVDAPVGRRVERRQALAHRGDLRARLLDGHAGLEAHDRGRLVARPPVVQRAVAGAHGGGHDDRDPDVVDHAGRRAAKAAGRHADDRQRVTVHANGLAQHVPVAAELGLPHAIAEDGDRGAAVLGAPFLGQERAAQHRLDLQEIEVVRRHELRPGARGLPVGAEAQRREAAEGDARDQLQVVAVIAVVEIGRVDQKLAGRCHRLDEGEAPGIADAGERVQQDAVDPAEHRRVDGDAQAERQHGDRGEPGAAAQDPESEPDVAREEREPPGPPPAVGLRRWRGRTSCPSEPSGACGGAARSAGGWSGRRLSCGYVDHLPPVPRRAGATSGSAAP